MDTEIYRLIVLVKTIPSLICDTVFPTYHYRRGIFFMDPVKAEQTA